MPMSRNKKSVLRELSECSPGIGIDMTGRDPWVMSALYSLERDGLVDATGAWTITDKGRAALAASGEE